MNKQFYTRCRERLLWLFSFFSPKPIKTGRSFTTSDEPANCPKSVKQIKVTGLGPSYKNVFTGKDFSLMSNFKESNVTIYRLYSHELGEIIEVDAFTFKRQYSPTEDLSCTNN